MHLCIFNGFTGRVEEMYVVHRIDHICHGLWRCPEFIPLIDRWEGGVEGWDRWRVFRESGGIESGETEG